MWVSKGFRVPLGPSGSSGWAWLRKRTANVYPTNGQALGGISPYTRRLHTRPESHLGKVCRPQQLEHALYRSCILLLGSWGNKASPHLETNTHTGSSSYSVTKWIYVYVKAHKHGQISSQAFKYSAPWIITGISFGLHDFSIPCEGWGPLWPLWQQTQPQFYLATLHLENKGLDKYSDMIQWGTL